MQANQTITKLQEMKLLGMLETYNNQQRTPKALEMSFDERFSQLIESEWLYRENRGLTRRIKNARLRQNASLEDINWTHRRCLEKEVISRLATSEWIRYGHNCIITGPTGVGKSYIGCALGQKACRDGYKVLYCYSPKLFREFLLAQSDGSFNAYMRKLSKFDLLIVDDWGLEQARKNQYRDFLELLEERYGKGATLITSQYPINSWHDNICDPTVADAILDRITHNSYKIEMKGGSMRKTKKNP